MNPEFGPLARIAGAIEGGRWKDPGVDGMRRLLGEDLGLPEIELFPTLAAMASVKDQVDRHFVGLPQFCLVRRAELLPPPDARVVFDDAIFVAGSTWPGDDVLVVVEGDDVKVIDWRREPPDRWVRVGSFDAFVEALGA